MSKWQSIETAPKDGSLVLLYLSTPPNTNATPAGLEDRHYVVGAYRGRQHDGNGWWVSDIVSFDHGYYRGEFDCEAERLEPTLWMPIPGTPYGTV